MPTARQKRAVDKTIENYRSDSPKSMGVILKEAGYSDATTTIPHVITESKGFKQLLEENLPEDLVTARHKDLLNASVINEYEFFAKEIYNDKDTGEDIDPDESDDLQPTHRYKGRGRKQKSWLKERIPIDDESIRSIVESVPGCKLIYIKTYTTGTKIAYFTQPDSRSRKEAIDMAYKLRGTYAPVKSQNLNLNIGDSVDNTKLDKLLNKVDKIAEDDMKQGYADTTPETSN